MSTESIMTAEAIIAKMTADRADRTVSSVLSAISWGTNEHGTDTVIRGGVVFSPNEQSHICKRAFNVTSEETAKAVPTNAPVSITFAQASAYADEVPPTNFTRNDIDSRTAFTAITRAVGNDSVNVEAEYQSKQFPMFHPDPHMLDKTLPEAHGFNPVVSIVIGGGDWMKPLTADDCLDALRRWKK